MDKEEQKPHAIFITYPLQGHVIPSVNLAIKLASKGFTITFINTDAIHHKTSKARLGSGGGGGGGDDDIFAGARKAGLDIRYRTVTDGLPVEFDRSVNHDQFMASLLHVFSAHVEVLVRKIIKSEPPVTCLIADTFFVWPSVIAKKFGLLYVSFWTEPALIFTLYYHIHLLRANSHFACHDKREDAIDYIPGVLSIEPTDLTSYLQDTDITTVCHQIIYKCFEDARGADFVLCNTVPELEPNTISALQVEMPFYAVGPIFPTKSIVATSLWSESDCTQWLNTKPHGSVLYVSFGSYANLSKREITEIAKGLHLSKVNILWVVRPDIVVPEEGDPLPDGYREGMGERGLIVQWCRQLEVLKHPAVGGFLTHCGWNSILETIWCGVPMLCYPLYTDQFTNRKLVVGDWMVGLDLCRSRYRVTKDEVAKKINLLMSGKDGEKCREEIKSVRKAFENATAADGSSSKNLDQFIVDLRDRTAAAPHRNMEVRV